MALIVVLSALALTMGVVGVWHLIGASQDGSLERWLEEKGEAPFRIHAECWSLGQPPGCLPLSCVIIYPPDCT